MLWRRRFVRSKSCDSEFPSTHKEWSLRPSSWLPAPGQVARRMISGAFPVHLLLHKNQDGNVDVYSSVRLSANYVKRLCAVLPLSSLNFSDIAMVVLQGGYAVVMAVTPQSVKDKLCLDTFPDFCSTRVVPFLASIQEGISDHKTEIITFAEQVLPTLRLIGGQSVVVIKLFGAKTLPFVCFCYEQIKPAIQKQLGDDKVKEQVLRGTVVIGRFLQSCVRNYSSSFATDLLAFVSDHRLEISRVVLDFLKVIIRTLIVATPVTLRLAQHLATMSWSTVEEAIRLVNTFVEENPDICNQLRETAAKLNALAVEKGYSSIDLLTMLCTSVAHGFALICKLIQILWPILSTFADVHSAVLLKILDGTTELLLPLISLLVRKLFSSESKEIVKDSLPLVTATVSLLYATLKPLSVYGLQNGIFILQKLPFVFNSLSRVSSFSFYTTISVTMGFLYAVCEISPEAIVACRENLPVVTSAVEMVLSDLWRTSKVVAPQLQSAFCVVSRDVWNAYRVVFPDLVKAVIFLYPDCVRAARAVAPVLLGASTEVWGTLYKAGLVVIPTTIHSITFVVPTIWTATKVASPVMLSASFTVYDTTLLALKEIKRSSHIALSEVISASSVGLSVVAQDVARSYRAVSQRSNFELEKSLRNGVYATTFAFQEVNSLLWILFRLKNTEVEALSQSQFQLKLNFWDRNEIASSLCRKSTDIMTFSMKAALFCKVCLRKSNSFAAASMYEANVKVVKCYEKMEPIVVDLAVKSGTYLKGVLNPDEALERTSDNDAMYRTPCSWYSSQTAFGKISLIFPKPTYSLQAFTTDVCHAIASVVSKAGSFIWHACLVLSPPLWGFIKTASPEIWHRICDVAPNVWSAFRKLSRKTWNGVRSVSPELYSTYRRICVLSWNTMCKIVPEVWKVVKEVSPDAWSQICCASSATWVALCNNGNSLWNSVCKHGPRVWKHLCDVTALSWDTYRRVISTSWRIFCLGVQSSWKVQRLAIIVWWQSLMVNKSAANRIMRESSPILHAMAKFGGSAWYYFCALTVLFVIVYQCDSVSDLFINSNFNGVDLSTSTSVLTSGTDAVDGKPHLPKARQALQNVVGDIVSVKSFFENAKQFFNGCVNIPSLSVAVRFHSELSIKWKAASEKVFSIPYIQGYHSFVSEKND